MAIFAPRPVFLRANYDLSRTTDENSRHWQYAKELHPDAELSEDIRRTLRIRCRYETRNNSYARGIQLTLAHDTIGTGPALRMLGNSERQNAAIETAFWRWMQATRLVRKLTMMRMARFDSGEAFAIFQNNPGIAHPVKLDVDLAEAEEIADPTLTEVADPDWIDGIRYDQFGNPVVYRRLREHPGTMSLAMGSGEYDDYEADAVWHYYDPARPGAKRGIPDLTPAAQLFGELRRFRNATIAAAETAADQALTIESDAPPDPDAAEDEQALEPEMPAFSTVGMERRMANIMPRGWKLSQMKPEQPTTHYEMFVNQILREVARCLCVPFHIASLDPSMANMSSSYVVGGFYVHERKVDRYCFEPFLDRCFELFKAEAALIDGYLPELERDDDTPHEWFWPNLGHHADPQKVANARSTSLACGATNLPLIYAEAGLDWQEQQLNAAKSLGVSVPEYQELLRNKLFGAAKAPEETPDENEDDESGEAAGNGNGRAARGSNGNGRMR